MKVESGKPSAVRRFLWFGNTVFHQALAVVIVYILWNVFQYNDLGKIMTWHMALTSLGYILFMVEAVVLFGGENIYSSGYDRKTKVLIHIILMAFAAVFTTTGISLIIYHKGPNGIHFKSNHAIFGLVSWIIVLLAVIIGVFARYPKILQSLLRPVWIKFTHVCLGCAGILFGIIALGYGFNKSSFKKNTSPEAITGAIVLMAIVTFCSLLDAFKTMYSQIKTIFGK